MGEKRNNSKENYVMRGQDWMGIFGAPNKRSQNKFTRPVILLLNNVKRPANRSGEFVA